MWLITREDIELEEYYDELARIDFRTEIRTSRERRTKHVPEDS